VLGIGAVIIFAWPSFWPVLFAESQMTFTEYTLDNTPINARPDCPQCAAQMYLARIEPEKPGHDLLAVLVSSSKAAPSREPSASTEWPVGLPSEHLFNV
jgi:hypothetical protein